MARPKKPAPPLTGPVVFERMMSCSDENGLMSLQPVRVTFDPDDGRFGVALPAHMIESPEDHAWVFSDRVIDLVQEFEQRNEAFSIAKLRTQATKHMLLIGLYSEVGEAGKTIRRIDRVAGLGMTEIAVNPSMPEQIYLREGEKTLSISIRKPDQSVSVPDTPEIRERLSTMLDSIQVAADVLNALSAAQDPVAYLMSLEGPWTVKAETPPVVEPEPVKVDTPFASDDEI